MPLAHHLEARKDADMAELGDPAEKPVHFFRAFRTFIEPRGVLLPAGGPEASLPATCGSDPIDLGPPFGGRQGTRLKMSPADFATSFTVSIVLAAMLFCCEGLD